MKLRLGLLLLPLLAACQDGESSNLQDIATDLTENGEVALFYVDGDMLIRGVCQRSLPIVRNNCRERVTQVDFAAFERKLRADNSETLANLRATVDDLTRQIAVIDDRLRRGPNLDLERQRQILVQELTHAREALAEAEAVKADIDDTMEKLIDQTLVYRILSNDSGFGRNKPFVRRFDQIFGSVGPNTPTPFIDLDSDGVNDVYDRCFDTPRGADVWRDGDWIGCASGQHVTHGTLLERFKELYRRGTAPSVTDLQPNVDGLRQTILAGTNYPPPVELVFAQFHDGNRWNQLSTPILTKERLTPDNAAPWLAAARECYAPFLSTHRVRDDALFLDEDPEYRFYDAQRNVVLNFTEQRIRQLRDPSGRTIFVLESRTEEPGGWISFVARSSRLHSYSVISSHLAPVDTRGRFAKECDDLNYQYLTKAEIIRRQP